MLPESWLTLAKAAFPQVQALRGTKFSTYIGWQIAGAYWIIEYGDVILRLTHLGASSFRFVIGNITYRRRAVARRAELEGVDDFVRSQCSAATPTLELRLLGAV